ncbi:MAG: aspartate aminotransferase family protein [Legionellales bacterium]|nr:aspartate aminotransferase family protein [Legionellales bacterium]|tara:strand:- start:31 stop:1197 length:1167 start_codon:yes stop_codon:yes gene_type:complete
MTHALLDTYNPIDVTFEYGKGAWLWDTNGKQYLDALGGIAVCALGHDHPAVTAAIHAQTKLLHTSNIYHIHYQEELADKICQMAGMSKVFFGNSGAEANEAAIKLCRLYGHHKNIENPKIVVMEKAFHGRTLATLSASGSRKVQAGFEPLVQGFIRAPYNDMDALKTIARKNHDIVAIMLEPIQGEGGIHVPAEDYLPQIRQLCDDHDWLMVLDEIQTGVGRTGRFYSYQHYDFCPDVATSAKALANGVPIGACLAHGKALDLFEPGKHGSTFGGNPFATRIALTVLETLEKDGLIEQAEHWGKYLLAQFKDKLSNHEQVVDIRGKGLMIGIELQHATRDILTAGLEHGILFSLTGGNVVRLLPPYIINQDEADQIVERVCKVTAAPG